MLPLSPSPMSTSEIGRRQYQDYPLGTAEGKGKVGDPLPTNWQCCLSVSLLLAVCMWELFLLTISLWCLPSLHLGPRLRVLLLAPFDPILPAGIFL